MYTENELTKYIAEDVKRYDGIRRHLKASLLERLFITKAAVSRLHPNPDDEFSKPEVGPNLDIVADYEKVLAQAIPLRLPIYEEPIIVEKMTPDGYMLINGHHRWAAAYKRKVNKVRVKLVNVIHESDVHRMLAGSSSDKRAVFDLEEVKYTGGDDAVEELPFPYKYIYKNRLKLGVAHLMNSLINRGYDVWVFTSEYYSEKQIDSFLKAYGVQVTGIVNGMTGSKAKRTQTKKGLAEAITGRYKITITVTQESVLYMNAATRDYKLVDITPTEGVNITRSILNEVDRIEAEHEAYGTGEKD